MKRFAQGLALLLGLAVASPALCYTGSYVPGSGINGTPHDLSIPGANGMNYAPVPLDPYTRICIWCHTPHNAYRLSPANGGPGVGVGAGPQAIDEFTYLPLWNHTLPTSIPPYMVYYNGPGAPQSGPKALNAVLSPTPGSVSLLCLSCHDGSIAVNSYGNPDQPPTSISTGTTTMAPGYRIGKDYVLQNHHPITFNYDDVIAAGDIEIRNADLTLMTSTSTIRDHLYGPNGGGLECASCHSVHNKGNGGERLLWRSDQNSELCLTCHDKGVYTTP